MIIRMNLGVHSYDIVVQRAILEQAYRHIDLNRRVLIVTDEGVPAAYAHTLARQCRENVIRAVAVGEKSKSLEIFGELLRTMLDHNFSRKDCVVALGGGVVGDLAGFATSAYMRGIDFYNIPTTLLSQIDSSIGGKTGINFGGVKNSVGAFYQPKKVLIDPELLRTLPPRHISNGLAEAIKMALTSDRDLFELFERKDYGIGNYETLIDEIIGRSLIIKKTVVEQDEKESGMRKILNFGHTIGHGIEASIGIGVGSEARDDVSDSCSEGVGSAVFASEGVSKKGGGAGVDAGHEVASWEDACQTTKLYHGECVALGLIPMCDEEIRSRVIEVLKKYNLYRNLNYDWCAIEQAAFHDKKADGGSVTVTLVHEPGSCEMVTMECGAVIERAKACLGSGKELSSLPLRSE